MSAVSAFQAGATTAAVASSNNFNTTSRSVHHHHRGAGVMGGRTTAAAAGAFSDKTARASTSARCISGGVSSLAGGRSHRRRAGGVVVYARVSGGERKTTSSSTSTSTNGGGGGGMANMSSQIKDMRAQMEEDEDLNTLMAGLRGSNIDDSDFAADGVQMKVVDMSKVKGGEGDDQLPLYYDPEIIAKYWRRRPAAVAQRIVQLTSIAGGFISGIAMDIARGKTEENSVKRAIQLRDIVTSLGPAYIKLGQALSIRPDLLSPDAMTELQKLCDKVPSFDNKLAFDTLEAELGCKWQEVYSSLGPEPVAAASLGQVYKVYGRTSVYTPGHWCIRPDIGGEREMKQKQTSAGDDVSKVMGLSPPHSHSVLVHNPPSHSLDTVSKVMGLSPPHSHSVLVHLTLRAGVLKSTGEDVAVKVQRPAVLETVSIDLYIIRRLGVALRGVPQINTDVVALLDEWAERFFEELDYVKEGENQTQFAASIKDDLPQVVVPRTYAEHTRRKVITSQWLEGEKLSQSNEDDVGDLVNIGVICYLKQLLDTGFFHADPHPGNLIRTPDGRLAILDFGLMTNIDDNIKFGMIEAIAHLIHRDYEAIVEDFVTLDFIPEGTDLKPILPPLSRVFDQALEGGGAKNINFQEVAADLAQITFDYPFRIPPYFALIIRAIGVLEGIALVGNPEFALVDEAYPYISKRLLTDDSPRLRESLKYMVYGKSQVFDADRLIDLLEALESFRVASRMSQGDGSMGVGGALLTDGGRGDGGDEASSSGRVSDGSAGVGGAGPGAHAGGKLPAGNQPAPPGLEAFFPQGIPAGFPFPGFPESPFGAGGPSPLFALPSVSSASSGSGAAVSDEDAQTREALQFVLSPEGSFFREFLLDEAVKGIDALGRDNAAKVLMQLGLADARVPLLLPGSLLPRSVKLSPAVTEEDKATVESVTKLLNFLLRGSRSGGEASGGIGASASDPSKVISELGPLLPAVATEILPELLSRLNSRLTARAIRDVFAEIEPLAAATPVPTSR